MFIKKLSDKAVSVLVFVFLGIFAVFTILMKASGDILNAAVYNIVDYEFLWNYDKYLLVMSAWSNTEINAAIVNTWLDFGWLTGYGGLIFTLNLKLSEKLQGRPKKLAVFAAWSGLVAVTFDILENICLLNMLYQTNLMFKGLPLIVSLIATVKFLFVFIGILTFFALLLFKVVKYIKSRRKTLKT